MNYHIKASFVRSAQNQDCSSPEVLGDEYGETYADLGEACEACDALQDSIASFGLAPSTRYSVYEGGTQVYCSPEPQGETLDNLEEEEEPE